MNAYGVYRKLGMVALGLGFWMVNALGAQGIILNAQLDQGAYLATEPGQAWLKVGLGGQSKPQDGRPEMNVCLVIDRSGSMAGEALEQAKAAARYAASLLRPGDRVSVVAYDDQAQVVYPAAPVERLDLIYHAINQIESGGSTALFAGVSLGAGQVRSGLRRDRVNRIILLSDGLANVGPSSVRELGSLGTALGREGISVTTLGLGTGYNEDLMRRLAAASDGNHAYVQEPMDLVRIFDSEFKDAMSIVALELEIEIEFKSGALPLRVLNRDAEIRGKRLWLRMNQVLGVNEKYFLVEVQLPPGVVGSSLQVAQTQVRYLDARTRRPGMVSASTGMVYAADAGSALATLRNKVREDVILQLATEENERAVRLRDEGRLDEAKKALEKNADFLSTQAKLLDSDLLETYASSNEAAAAGLGDEEAWASTRKALTEEQYQNKTQQTY